MINKQLEHQAQIVLHQIVELRIQIERLSVQNLNGGELATLLANPLLEQIAKNTIESLGPLAQLFGLLSLEQRLRICKAALNIFPI